MNDTVKEQDSSKKQRPFEYIYPPFCQIVPSGAYTIGYIMRCAAAAAAVTGLLLFIADAFRLRLSPGAALLISAAWTFVFSVMCLSRRAALASLGVIAAAALAVTFFFKEAAEYLFGALRMMWNMVMERLDSAGYQTLGRLEPFAGDGQTLTLTEGAALIIAFSALGAALALIFTVCTARKTRLFPPLLTGVAVCSAIFTYNISSSNTGFAVILSALCSLIVLKLYDSFYMTGKNAAKGERDPENAYRTAALGGYAAFAALALSLLILVVPAGGVKKRWDEIEFINSRLNYARSLISSVIIGDSPYSSDLGFGGDMDSLNVRTAKAEERSFSGKIMFSVEASYNIPVYMRSWIGLNYYKDSWYPAGKDEAERYGAVFPENFTPEILTYNFYSAVNPKLTVFNNLSSYANHIEDGFVTMTIDVSNVTSTGNLLYIPSVINPKTALLEYGTRDYKPYGADWENYCEGIVKTGWLNFNKKYRAAAFVPIYRSPDIDKKISDNLKYYQLAMNAVIQLGLLSPDEDQKRTIAENFENLLDSHDIRYASPTIVERFMDMDAAEKQDFIFDHVTLNQLYANYVKERYLAAPEEDMLDVFLPIVNKIQTDLTMRQKPLTIHNKVLGVVDYLSENCVYTLSPRSSADTGSGASALRVFLQEVKEGYCVQFATAAAMLLRSMGVPARYVEGYIAPSFRRSEEPGRAGNYISDVRDYNAHAWIEVYAEGIGWMLYETTPAYYIDMYAPYEQYTSPQSSGTYTDEPLQEIVTDDSETVTNGGAASDSGTVFRFILFIIISAAAAVTAIGVLKWRKASRIVLQKRYDAAARASKSALEGERLRAAARELNDYIMEIYSIEGCVPEEGELPSEYARRVCIAMDDAEFGAIMGYIEREEFGPGVTRGELKDMADYMRRLWDRVYGKLSAPRRFWLRHIKMVI